MHVFLISGSTISNCSLWDLSFNFDRLGLFGGLLLLAVVEVLKVFECNYDNRKIIKRPLNGWAFQDCVGHFACYLMDSHRFTRTLVGLSQFLLFVKRLSHCRPRGINHIYWRKPIKNSITPKNDEIMRVFINCELRYLWRRCYNTGFTSKLFEFGLNVSESSRHTESARKNSIRTIKHLSLSSGYLSELVCYWNVLKSLGLINLTSIVLNSVKFSFFIWTMILWQIVNSHPTFRWHNCSTVTNISHIAFSFDSKNNDRARSWFIKSRALISNFQKSFFSNSAPIFECLNWISWKAVLSNNNLMKMIFEEISTHATSMAIIDSKERAFWPCIRILTFWPCHIQNDWDSILIIIPLNALMSIGRITCNQSMTLGCKFCVFKILQGIISWLLITK